jgi:phage baseplate assembly protein gpV
MHKSEMSIYRAVISEVDSTKKTIYVRIPNVLGASTSIALAPPTASTYGWTWDPAVGDQVIVAVEGTEFDKVYLLSVI